jgi:hypothetical protein
MLQAESDAKNPQLESCRAIFERSARVYAAFTGKLDQIAKAVSASACRRTWHDRRAD